MTRVCRCRITGSRRRSDDERRKLDNEDGANSEELGFDNTKSGKGEKRARDSDKREEIRGGNAKTSEVIEGRRGKENRVFQESGNYSAREKIEANIRRQLAGDGDTNF